MDPKDDCVAKQVQLADQLSIYKTAYEQNKVVGDRHGYALSDADLGALQKRAFEWQFVAADVMLFLTAFLVVSGVVLCAHQVGFFRLKKNIAVQGESQIDISIKSLSIKSPFVGISILGISLLFAYLFIERIYQITLVHDLSLQ